MADADNDPVLQIKLTSVRRYDEALAEAEARGYARGLDVAAVESRREAAWVKLEGTECIACATRSDRLPCEEHLPDAMREIEARGYARGVEDAAKAIMREGFGGTPCHVSVRSLLKPKGEAK